MHTVAGESILRDFRVLVDSHGAPNAEIELELEVSCSCTYMGICSL